MAGKHANRRRRAKRSSNGSSIEASLASLRTETSPSNSIYQTHSPVEELTFSLAALGSQQVCFECEELYALKISTAQFGHGDSNNAMGRYLGRIQHISSTSKCSMCQFLFEMRSDDSETNDYHLHAFSASMTLFQTTMKELVNDDVLAKDSLIRDSPLFAVIANIDSKIPISVALGFSNRRGFFAACQMDQSGHVVLPRYNEENMNRGSVEDAQHKDILNFRSPTKKHRGFIYPLPQAVSLREAVEMSRRNRGFITISEKGKPTFYTTKELEQREKSGTPLNLSVWPVRISDIEDPDTPGQRGYIPYEVRRRLYTRSLYGRIVDHEKIDFNLIRKWIDHCRNRPSLPNRSYSCEEFTVQRNRLKNLKLCLLDCTNREVIEPDSRKNLEYVALSYVWGHIPQKFKPTVQTVPYQIPDTCCAAIEDAIQVTIQLGFQYLWVDMLCISSSSSLRHNQIGNMDAVYKSASLTIVAAAGSDASHGLPGVGHRIRIRQPDVYVRNHRFVSTLPDPAHTLQESVYQTRAWTYQEFFFSARRLIFTDHEVFFQCRYQCRPSFRRESISFPPFNKTFFESRKDHNEDAGGLLQDKYLRGVQSLIQDTRYFMDGSFVASPAEATGTKKLPVLAIFEYFVHEYTNRKLSFDSDALAAIISVLDRFRNETISVQHLAGIPFTAGGRSQAFKLQHNAPIVKHMANFAYGLSWTHGANTQPTRRRQKFASWTWAGWEGQVNWLIGVTNMADFSCVEDTVTKFEYENERHHQDFTKAETWRSGERSEPPSRLRITAKVVKVLIAKREEEIQKYVGYFLVDKDPHLSCRLHVTDLSLDIMLQQRQPLYGVCLGSNELDSVVYLLIIRRIPQEPRGDESVFDRVGVMIVPSHWYNDASRKPFPIKGWFI